MLEIREIWGRGTTMTAVLPGPTVWLASGIDTRVTAEIGGLCCGAARSAAGLTTPKSISDRSSMDPCRPSQVGQAAGAEFVADRVADGQA